MVLEDQLNSFLQSPVPELTIDELLLIDWALCSSSGCIPGASLQELQEWRPFRESLWEVIIDADFPGPNNVNPKPNPFDVGPVNASILLPIIPTSFRWGTGPDCGFTLKIKLAKVIFGRDPNANKNQASSNPAPPDAAAA
ncbi:MAG: hypothetical protein GWN86_07010 [Desulfobacterales bacterium]|nr:hypothetical protein [Desulfobacterales bacterium]